MLRTEDEIQLEVWKDLAISKQMLMGAATKALGLNPECSTEDLREALEQAIKRAKDADATIVGMREKTDNELAEMSAKLEASEKAAAEAAQNAADANEALEAAERQLVVGKSENAKALKEAKADVADKQNKLKAISKSLADTPENVVKKLKALKKQKLEDAKSRTQLETLLRTTRKEKTEVSAELETHKAQLEQITPLIEQLRELHSLCNQANEKIKSLSESEDDLLSIPELDETLLESLDQNKADEETEQTAESA